MGHYDKFLEEKNGNRIDDAITKLGDAVDGVINEDVINYEVSWVCGGKAESAIIEGWRLSGAI